MDFLDISQFDYDLPEEKIARFPLPERDSSKLLIYRNGSIEDSEFSEIITYIPENSLLVFNNTKVIRARLLFFKETGARIEIFCLEPYEPADYECAFAIKGSCKWRCIVGNLKKWKEGDLAIDFYYNGAGHRLSAERRGSDGNNEIIKFTWDSDMSFGTMLEILGRIPIPPYLRRDSEEIDNSRYQTVYSKIEGSVAAPTAGLHFSVRILNSLSNKKIATEEVTLHVGAGTFLPVKGDNAAEHTMHTEHFEINTASIENLIENYGRITAVGTTSVRTLESLPVLGYRIMSDSRVNESRTIGQWEAYDIPESVTGKELLCALLEFMRSNGMDKLKGSTQIMITPAGFRFRVINSLITNFHQPKSTLLLLISAITGEDWKKVYDHALTNNYRFLSYGDSSILFLPDQS
ncbi:MAG: S-adenosylmethionine:tRNA ribosyltransferase-isomerase [Rikenellaceae bacterium]|nr:S-adenosylmethionine:tRNA ribosyltransferase-isomerase [Rikenellaceae bacterium]